MQSSTSGRSLARASSGGRRQRVRNLVEWRRKSLRGSQPIAVRFARPGRRTLARSGYADPMNQLTVTAG
jgi:hypothetical protein